MYNYSIELQMVVADNFFDLGLGYKNQKIKAKDLLKTNKRKD